jgi:hypothetical protein
MGSLKADAGVVWGRGRRNRPFSGPTRGQHAFGESLFSFLHITSERLYDLFREACRIPSSSLL